MAIQFNGKNVQLLFYAASQQPGELQTNASCEPFNNRTPCSIILVRRGFENRSVEEACIKQKHSTVEQDSKLSCVAAWYFAIIYQMKAKLLGTNPLTYGVRFLFVTSTWAFPMQRSRSSCNFIVRTTINQMARSTQFSRGGNPTGVYLT